MVGAAVLCRARPLLLPGCRQATTAASLLSEYKRLPAWRDLAQLETALQRAVLYSEPGQAGLVVLSKPHGLPRAPAKDCQYSLEQALGGLARRLGRHQLEVVRCTERYTSGLTLLGGPGTSKRYQATMARARHQRLLVSSWLAVVRGQPGGERLESVDLRLEDCPGVTAPLLGSRHKEPVLSRQLLTKAQAGRASVAVKRVHFQFSAVSRCPSGAGLVRLAASNTGNHLLSVYLADLGCPALGDQLYDYRSRTMLGQPVRLTTAHTAATRHQLLPRPLLDKLGLQPGEEWQLPKFLHQHRLVLPGWLEGGADLTLTAPPPPHWLSTCSQLGLKLDPATLADEDLPGRWEERPENARRREARAVRAKEKREAGVVEASTI